jgi:hypothetical protein
MFWSVVGGRWSVVRGPWSVVRGPWSVDDASQALSKINAKGVPAGPRPLKMSCFVPEGGPCSGFFGGR